MISLDAFHDELEKIAQEHEEAPGPGSLMAPGAAGVGWGAKELVERSQAMQEAE